MATDDDDPVVRLLVDRIGRASKDAHAAVKAARETTRGAEVEEISPNDFADWLAHSDEAKDYWKSP